MPRRYIREAAKRAFPPYFFGREVYRGESEFNRIRVVDKRGYRFLIFDDPSFAGKYPEEIFQGCLSLKDPVNTSCPYADYFHFAFTLRPAIKSVFMVGLGSGLVPLQFPQAQGFPPSRCFGDPEAPHLSGAPPRGCDFLR